MDDHYQYFIDATLIKHSGHDETTTRYTFTNGVGSIVRHHISPHLEVSVFEATFTEPLASALPLRPSFIEIGFCHEGAGTFTINGRETMIGTNQLFMFHVPTDETIHSTVTMSGYKGWNLTAALPHCQVVPLKTTPYLQVMTLPPYYYEQWRALMNIATERRTLEAEIALQQQAWTILRDGLQLFQTDEIGHVKQFIDANLTTCPSVEQLARDFQFNRMKLQSLFKQQYGTTIYQYIIEQKLQRATLLLAQGISVDEVAWQLGYQQASQFSRRFRARFGVSPLQYVTS